ncbi:reverse transcriptase domain-containing protein [Tanacetum coccineum]
MSRVERSSEGGRPLEDRAGLFADSTSCITSFVHWIESHPLPDGLKMTSHVGSYDGKGVHDNYLHLFEGFIHMQKWGMPVACHMFIYTLKDSTRIWWNSHKAGSIVNYEDLKAKFWSHFIYQKKFTKTHLAVHNIKEKEGESIRAFVTRYTNDTLPILGLHEEQCISGFVYGLRTRNLVEFLSTDLPTTYKESSNRLKRNYSWDNNNGKRNKVKFSPYRRANHGFPFNLSKSPRGILAIEKVAKTLEQPPRMFRNRRLHDMTLEAFPSCEGKKRARRRLQRPNRVTGRKGVEMQHQSKLRLY